MYIRLQIVDTDTGNAVCALVAPPNLVSRDTLQQWAQGIADSCNAITQSTTHVVQGMEPQRGSRAFSKLKGAKPGQGGNYGIKPRGICTKCGGEYPLNKWGLISKHGKVHGKRTESRCAGVGKRPATVTKVPGADGQLEAVVLEKS